MSERPRTRRWTPLLAGAVLLGLLVPGHELPASAGEPAVPGAAEVPAAGRYRSTPPALGGSSQRPADARPAPARAPRTPASSATTRGTVTGRLVDRQGRPLGGVLVEGVRFSDLRSSFDQDENPPVQTRTGPDGGFRLPQYAERYLVRLCDAPEDQQQCTSDPDLKRFAPTYVGPDGTTDSWLTQTRLFTPTRAGRALGTVRARPSAILAGTFADGGHRFVRLLRRNGTTAATVLTDAAGRYRFEVAPGRYRVEVDRIEGLRTVATVPGFRSRLLHLTARRATDLDFATAPAATIYGLVTAAGEPVADQFVAVTDSRGRFAAGVVTDADGRYVIDALEPGRYTVSTPAAATSYVPVARSFTIGTREPTRADLELSDGGRLVLTLVYGPASDSDAGIVIELRDAAGAVTESAYGAPGESISFPGLAPGRYQVVARRVEDDPSERPEDAYPWAERLVEVSGSGTVDLGRVVLDQPLLTLTGTTRPRARIRITPLLDVPYLREDFTEGSGVTGMSVTWLTNADTSGRYEVHGLVPGRYFVAVTAQYLQPDGSPTDYRGNIATTHSMLTVTARTTHADLAAPRGGRVTGRFRYAGTHRPVIAPVAFRVRDGGARSRLLPLLSRPQTYGGGFTVDRLHTGAASRRAVDIREVLDLADFQGEELPDTLTDSAGTEPGTPYWFTSTRETFRTTPGRTTDLGWVDLRVRR